VTATRCEITRKAGRAAPLREQDVVLLRQVATGAQTEVIARRLGVSERTVRRRVRGICERLELDTAVEAVVWAAHRGLV
jgi:DNA-binding NarL/FixJ family response regulator